MEGSIKINDRSIGQGAPCFIVAEISGNHLGKFDEAVALVKAAKKAGADAVKLQTYTPDTITLNSDREWFRVGGEETPRAWKGKTLYELYREAYTPWEWQPKLKKIADELGIILFSSPFDETAVDFLEEMRVSCYKIAAYEATDFLLLRKVAKTGKPVIISFCYSSEEEIAWALKTLRSEGAGALAALHCVTSYRSAPNLKNMHLRNIQDLQKRFGVIAGFSDNNAGIDIPVMAVAVGARIIEKHLILDRKTGGPDARFSIEPEEFKKMVLSIRAFESGTHLIDVSEEALGDIIYGPKSAEERYNMRWRRSLFAARDIKKGERLTSKNIRDVRPSFGLSTKWYDEIIGRRAARDIPFATPLSWEVIEEN
ncbi:MAG: N-acetylneuraminate synthase [Parcubacteria group bacterium Greene0416_79]|nr:MAG: N-acetylneuraminate synthase [Parcubacteria group bacterium Greene0416_79]